jgi:hypothetical protein
MAPFNELDSFNTSSVLSLDRERSIFASSYFWERKEFRSLELI